MENSNVLTVAALSTDYQAEGGRTVRAAQDVAFEVPEGKLFTLLGPSGCGKTTTLRSIAGLERPRAGEIRVDGRVVYSSEKRIFVAPNRRNFGMVFQSYAIWPHMTVFQNAAFPLEVRRNKGSRREIADKVMRVLDAVALAAFAERPATQLSGGQQQRLALARALVMEPRLLLLDEPLSNLDAKLRERMRFELKRLQRELRLTTVYVTHDQDEALALSHEIAVMQDGRVVQVGSPRDIYERPATRFVADFVGSTNFIAGSAMADGRDERARISTPLGDVTVRCSEAPRRDDTVVVSVRPEDVELFEQEPERRDFDNVFQGVVAAKVFLGDRLDFQVRVGDSLVLARVHPSCRTPVGDNVYLRVSAEKCIAIRSETAAAGPPDV